MHVAELHFKSLARRQDDAQVDAIHALLGAYYKGGQTARTNAPLARVRGGYRIVMRIPERDALARRHGNSWVRKSLLGLRAVGLSTPKGVVIGPEPETKAPCACSRRPFLILFTTVLNDEPAVRCGGCFGPVSLYRLPPTDDQSRSFQDLLFWADAYQSMDDVFIGSGPGERFAHGQMSRHDSELSTDGREVAASLEKKTRVPVYYYLAKYFARSERLERQRRCPSCGGKWLLAARLHRLFDFQCRRCRLLANIATNVAT